jgi:hypothetical protein
MPAMSIHIANSHCCPKLTDGFHRLAEGQEADPG